MIEPLPHPPAETTSTDLAVDHIGVVVHDLVREVAAWRGHGFKVSDPVPLMGRDASGAVMALGQRSAHVVFNNGYIELSQPIPGSGNHLEPYLAKGEGVRILVAATHDAVDARAMIAAQWPGTPEVKSAERRVTINGTTETARFRWFPLPFDVVPGVLSAVVEHQTPHLVFHASFIDHPNGLVRISRIWAQGNRTRLVPLRGLVADAQVPRLHWVSNADPPAIRGIAFTTAVGAESMFAV